MNTYAKYDKFLKDDVGNEIYTRLLASAETKILWNSDDFSGFEICALVDGMAEFPKWDVPVDYWTPGWADSFPEEIINEYATRKLCCLIDTDAPRDEIEKWYCRFDEYGPNNDSPLSEAEQKIVAWYQNQIVTPEEFTESLNTSDILSLLDGASDFPFHDLPTGNSDYEYKNWTKYQIVRQYIKSILCYWLDQSYSEHDITLWYNINNAFKYIKQR